MEKNRTAREGGPLDGDDIAKSILAFLVQGGVLHLSRSEIMRRCGLYRTLAALANTQKVRLRIHAAEIAESETQFFRVSLDEVSRDLVVGKPVPLRSREEFVV